MQLPAAEIDPALFAPTLWDAARGLGVHGAEEYFGLWWMHEDRFRAAVECLQGVNLGQHVRARQALIVPVALEGEDDPPARGPGYTLESGVALIEVRGALMKRASSLSSSSSTIEIRQALRRASRDQSVQSILLVIDSPGGTVAGTQALGDDVAAANKLKPVEAYIEDLGASAAYWIASQARRIAANRSALVGSIGTYSVLYDESAAAAMQGVKVHVIRTGPHKGQGVPGSAISPETLADAQRIVDGLQAHFEQAIATGRDLPAAKVRELADGRVHLAAEARSLGLIDAVESLDATLARLAGRTSSSSSKGSRAMSQTPTPAASADAPAERIAAGAIAIGSIVEPVADYHELKAACIGADPAFLTSQLERNATLSQARNAWMEEQGRQLAAARQATEQARAAAARPGVPPVVGSGSAAPATAASGDPIAQFNEAVRERMELHKEPKHVAHRKVCQEQPDLAEAYVAAYNAAHQKRRKPAAA